MDRRRCQGLEVEMNEREVPKQYQPILGRYIIKITEAVHYMSPVLQELDGKKLTVECEGWTITIEAREKT